MDNYPCAASECPRETALSLAYCDIHEWRMDVYDGSEKFLTDFLKG